MALEAHIAELSEKHKALERKLEEELARPSVDTLKMSELKREKLKLKDEIARIQSMTTH